jgi:hypothetical protein
MRCPSLRHPSLVLVLGFGLSLACSSASPNAEPDAAAKAQAQAPTIATAAPATPTDDEPKPPVVGQPAPAFALDSLAGTRVQLPNKASKRATVLMFGSFS